jgi:predicted RNase H-like nuclease (RuvC/YqgF family)
MKRTQNNIIINGDENQQPPTKKQRTNNQESIIVYDNEVEYLRDQIKQYEQQKQELYMKRERREQKTSYIINHIDSSNQLENQILKTREACQEAILDIQKRFGVSQQTSTTLVHILAGLNIDYKLIQYNRMEDSFY